MTESDITNLTSQGFSLEAIAAILGGYLLVLLVLAIIWVIANWKIFTKMGEAGWKSIIPIYNGYILFKRTWNTKMFWISVIVSCAGGLVDQYMDSTLGSVISGILTIVAFVIFVKQLYYQSKAFGHGGGFTVGLVLLNTIFVLILGFGKSRYIGNPTERKF